MPARSSYSGIEAKASSVGRSPWPFPKIAATAAAARPDLVIHVGDYHYREAPCPAERAGCANSPSGYGFDGLVAGLLARGSVGGVIAASLLFGFLRSGGINMEMFAGVPTALVMVIQVLIVITLAGSSFWLDRRTAR